MKFVFLSLFVFSSSFLAADEVPAMPPRDQGIWQTFIMIGIALAFFYFILWRPEQKRRKALDEQRSQMKEGDNVIAMGIVGKIAKVKEETVVLKMIDGNQIEVLKGAITEVK
jgi:preprotein translocase subunit YajC